MRLWDPGALLTGKYLDWLLLGIQTTLALFAVAWIGAFVLALLLTAVRATRIRVLESAVAVFVEYHRNVPALVQLLLWYFGLPQLLPYGVRMWANAHGSEFIFAAIALTLNSAAYMSEDLRSGLRTLASTQLEAARALGLSYAQAMRDVLLPQALRAAVPPLTSQTLSLFKTTSLAMAIGAFEMTAAARRIENETFMTFEAFLIISVLYLAGSYSLIGIGHALNLWLKPEKRR